MIHDLTQNLETLHIGKHPIRIDRKLKNTILTISKRANAPLELAVTSVLSAMSFAVQSHVKVNLPYQKLIPVSLFTLVIAPSGSGKSSVTDIAWQIPRDLMKTLAPDNDILGEYEADERWWQTRLQKLEKSVAKAPTKDDPVVIELREHIKLKPQPPMRPEWIFDDTTPEALLHSMATIWPNVALASAEGGTILQGRAIAHLPQFNQSWSGELIRIMRRTQEPILVIGLLTIAIMTQQNSFDAFMSNKNNLARASGFFARTLICATEATDCPVSDYYEPSTWYNDQMTLLLTSIFENPNKAPLILEFSAEANHIWQNYVEQVKAAAKDKNHPYHQLADHIAKLPEMVARIAGIIGYFQSLDQISSISKDDMQTATDLMAFYLDQAAQIFNPQPPEAEDAKSLVAWFEQEIEKVNMGLVSRVNLYQQNLQSMPPQMIYSIDKSTLHRFVPRSVRGKVKLDRAIDHLIEQGTLSQQFDASRREWLLYSTTFTQNNHANSHYRQTTRYDR